MENSITHFFQIIVLLCTFSITTSCHQNTPHLLKIDEISAARNFDEMYKGYFENDSMSCMIKFNTKEKKLYFQSIYDLHKVIAISIDHVLTNIDKRALYTLNFFVQTPDSVFMSYDDLIFLINGQGNIINSWKLNEYHTFEDNKLSLSFVTPITFQKGKLNLALTAKLKVNNPATSKNYFSTINPVAVLDIVNDSLYILPLSFPEVYQTGNNYEDFVPHFINFQNKLLVSFSVSDSLYIYNYETKVLEKTIALRSRNYKTPEPYPFDSIRNFTFARRYDYSQMRYKNVYYDKQSEFLLRMVSLPTEYIVPGSPTVKRVNDWSLILYDLNNNQVIDELFFNSDDYQPYLLATKRGIMIWKMTPQIMDSLKIEIYKIQKSL
jgi:hypothetical protein